jgi:molybdate transport repressor ModE-like protein
MSLMQNTERRKTLLKRMNKVDWNDLRFVVAIMRNGSAAAAARMLGVSHATVLRRVQALEQTIGTPLFDRLASGYVATEAGEALGELGTSIEIALSDTTRVIDARHIALAGTIRFTTTDSLAYCLLPPILASFSERYPSIEVQLLVSNHALDLDKRDADVTLRPSASPPQSWVGKPLLKSDFGIYATPTYLARKPDLRWQDLDWLLPGSPLSLSPASQWLRSEIGERPALLTVDSFIGLREMALNHLGATILPCFVADARPGLERIRRADRSAAIDLWLLTHANMRQSPRIRIFMEYLTHEIRLLKDRIDFSEELP